MPAVTALHVHIGEVGKRPLPAAVISKHDLARLTHPEVTSTTHVLDCCMSLPCHGLSGTSRTAS